MTDICDTLLAEIRANITAERTSDAAILQSSRNIEDLLKRLLARNEAVAERYIVNGYTIPKQDSYDVPPISSPEYERCRIFVSVGFTENTTGGIAIDLYYAGHLIGEIMEVKPITSGMSAGSEAFDINRISGFNFVIRNLDVGQEAKINTLKIVLYNE